jgi:hypothetical protein
MSYNYQTQKPFVFTEDGQDSLIKVRDFAFRAIEMAGAVRMDAMMRAAGSGSSWDHMACVDRLVERGDIKEVSLENCAGQYRIFTRYPQR